MTHQELAAWISAIASAVSAVGVLLAIRQLRLTKGIAQKQFEDHLAREYRDLAGQLPVKALLGRQLNEDEYREAFDKLFRYIDLCNEQVFLRQQDRISLDVWENWCAGIESNLRRPAFGRAWGEIKAKCESFAELRRLETEEYKIDPLKWGETPATLEPQASARG